MIPDGGGWATAALIQSTKILTLTSSRKSAASIGVMLNEEIKPTGRKEGTMGKPQADVVSVDAVEVMRGLRKGRMLHELSAKLEELTTAVRENNKKGDLTIKLTVSPLGKGDAEGMGAITVVVDDTIKLNKPEPRKASTIFFASRKGALTRNNPDQMEMPSDAGFPQE